MRREIVAAMMSAALGGCAVSPQATALSEMGCKMIFDACAPYGWQDANGLQHTGFSWSKEPGPTPGQKAQQAEYDAKQQKTPTAADVEYQRWAVITPPIVQQRQMNDMEECEAVASSGAEIMASLQGNMAAYQASAKQVVDAGLISSTSSRIGYGDFSLIVKWAVPLASIPGTTPYSFMITARAWCYLALDDRESPWAKQAQREYNALLKVSKKQGQ
jgi:hypothetical protein